MAEDYYSVLGVPRTASQAEIQKAYRDLARKHHPDLNPDNKTAKKKFQRVQAAFDVLNDPEKRKKYDLYGSSFESAGAGDPRGAYTWTWPPGAGGAQAGPGPGGFNPEDVDLGQIFGEQFGQGGGGFGDLFGQFRRAGGKSRKAGRGAGGPARGADLVQEVQIPLNTAVTGGEVQLTVDRPRGKKETLGGQDSAGHRGRQENPRPRPRSAGASRRHARRHPADRPRVAPSLFLSSRKPALRPGAGDPWRGGGGREGGRAHAAQER